MLSEISYHKYVKKLDWKLFWFFNAIAFPWQNLDILHKFDIWPLFEAQKFYRVRSFFFSDEFIYTWTLNF